MGRLYLSYFNSPRIMEKNAITNVNKKLVNHTVSFETEQVPLNGLIVQQNLCSSTAVFVYW